MNYYVCEGKAIGDYNASTKARNDVEKILNKMGYEKYFIPTKYGVQENKLLKVFQIYTYLKNRLIWNKTLKNLKNDDVLLFQYPILNTCIGLNRVIKKYTKKGIKIIALIHDLDSLRYTPEVQGKMLCRRVKKEDVSILSTCSYIIAHNEKMKEKLIELGIEESKIMVLQLFDYLVDIQLRDIEYKKEEPIVIAGNLSSKKAKYLKYLNTIQDVEFNLYGKGYERQVNDDNINYKGAFLPEELLNNLQGSFGLVWDGISKQTCTGGFGDYLKYNNPHKVSMYLTAGLPIIVWKEAALAKFIETERLGFSINSLDEIKPKIAKLSENDYIDFLCNAKKISMKLRNGYFLEKCIKKLP